MLIQELERLSELDRVTIRFYEKEGMIHPARKENKYRDYSQEDLEQLLKIRLLRQLGLSLEEIRGFQQGNGDLSTAISRRLKELEQEKLRNQRTGEVCQRIREEGESYQVLNARRYLKELNAPSRDDPQPKTFQEQVRREVHPWRRYFARMIDHSLILILLEFILAVVLKLRPLPNNFLINLIRYSMWWLMIPVNALSLKLFGTTLGKWIMGIRVEYETGEKLTYGDARERERQALASMWWGLPLLMYIGMWRASKAYEEEGDPDYDREFTVTYHQWNGKRVALAFIAVILLLMLGLLCAFASVQPPEKGKDLTVAQYVKNYNFFATIIQDGNGRSLEPDGSVYQDPTTAVIYLAGQPTGDGNCKYITDENGSLEKITCQNTYTELLFAQPIAGGGSMYALAALGGQPGVNSIEAAMWLDEINEAGTAPSGVLTKENVTLKWNVTGDGFQISSDGTYTSVDDENRGSITCEFEITID